MDASPEQSSGTGRPKYPMYHVQLPPEQARELVEKGGALLILDLSEGAVFGVDHQMFLTGPRFKGVKMLPPGPHFFFTKAASGQGDYAPTCGFFLHVAPRSVHVRRWDPQLELLVALADEEEAERYAAGVRRMDFDQGLAPYDLGSLNRWRSLSDHIKSEDIDRLQPLGLSGNISITTEEDVHWTPQTDAEREMMAYLEAQRSKFRHEGAVATGGGRGGPGSGDDPMDGSGPPSGPRRPAGRCFYTAIPRHAGAGLAGERLTAANLDKSGSLELLLATHFPGRPDALLAEFQFAFLAFVLGQSLEGFHQWKGLLRLHLSCTDAAVGARSDLFASFLQALRAQLDHALPDGPAADVEDGSAAAYLLHGLLEGSFLRPLLASFYEGLADAGVAHGGPTGAPTTAVGRAADRLHAAVERRLGWRLRGRVEMELLGEGGDGEGEGPVVVELPEGFELPELPEA